ncbi:hypothetical protein EVJ58_g5829 [Rhodofomes roseus]|uniref:Uncharacterized protein n=1 Tax=Rhodofomes roseus TaxID=34475 RepID=A0A4Y9YB13_9APHY|nr:hypothetical protein EVJ58_g5829 [Rhodofomes roseus]
MSENHKVTRGHKAAMNNASVSEEAKDNSRRTLAGFEGSENPEDFNASVASEETHNYDPHNASELGDRNAALRFSKCGPEASGHRILGCDKDIS